MRHAGRGQCLINSRTRHGLADLSQEAMAPNELAIRRRRVDQLQSRSKTRERFKHLFETVPTQNDFELVRTQRNNKDIHARPLNAPGQRSSLSTVYRPLETK